MLSHIAVLTLMVVAPPEYLTEVVSPVHQVDATPAELARRAEVCMSQTLAASADAGSVIVSSDPERGVVVGSNALEYRDGMLPWRMRSRVTFEGREGRFRITHTAIQRFNEQSFGAQVLSADAWQPVGKWRGSGWQKAEQALQGISTQIADCVLSSEPSADDW